MIGRVVVALCLVAPQALAEPADDGLRVSVESNPETFILFRGAALGFGIRSHGAL